MMVSNTVSGTPSFLPLLSSAVRPSQRASAIAEARVRGLGTIRSIHGSIRTAPAWSRPDQPHPRRQSSGSRSDAGDDRPSRNARASGRWLWRVGSRMPEFDWASSVRSYSAGPQSGMVARQRRTVAFRRSAAGPRERPGAPSIRRQWQYNGRHHKGRNRRGDDDAVAVRAGGWRGQPTGWPALRSAPAREGGPTRRCRTTSHPLLLHHRRGQSNKGR